jgi:photosystem II stability/assembly factor-like uncharacterized protein
MRHALHRAPLVLLLTIVATMTLAAQIPYETFHKDVRPKGREEFFFGIRAYPFGKIPQNARLNALDYVSARMQSFGEHGHSLLSAPPSAWKQIGPLNVGGRIRAIAVHPTDGKTLWVGAADGGVWKSTNRGDSWTPVMDNENAISMGGLAVDPSNPNILYAGTGEMSSNIDAYTGAGVFKSTDGGTTWRGSGLTSVGAFSKIIVHPKNGNLVFAGATKNNGGFYRSEDGGQTWSRTLEMSVSDVTINPANELEVWAGTMSSGIYHSTDGGKTFKVSNTGLGQATLARISLQAAASNPSTLYAVAHETAGSGASVSSYSYVYKSTNSGTNWTLMLNNNPNFLNTPGAQGWYNNAIAVSPTDPQVVLGLGVSIVRTSNGGTSWQFINAYGGALHPDQHAIAFDPTDPTRVYVGNDGGVYRSDNGGQSYVHKSSGLAVTQFYGMGVDQQATNTTYAGSQDNGTMSNGGNSILGGDGAWCFVDFENSGVIYAEREEGQMYRLEGGSGTTLINGLNASESVAWAAPWAQHPSNSNALVCGRQSIYVSFDRGDNWTATTGTFKGKAISITYSRVNPDVIYAGSDRGEILVTTDGGSNWNDRTFAPGVPNRAVTDFAPSLTEANIAYMTVSGFYADHVFKTTDYGASWTSVSKGLPDIPFNTIALQPGQERVIYVGSDIGMFISTDGGGTWSTYNNGLPRVAVIDLEAHRSSSTLRLATHGRSMFEIPLEVPDAEPVIVSPVGGEVWMGGSSQSITWNGFSGPVKLEVSLDNGSSWHLLASNLAGSAYRWVVIDTAITYALVRATNGDGTQSATSRSFTITRFTRGGTLGTTQVRTIPYGIAFDGEYLWATDFGSDTLLKINPNTLQTVGVVQMNLIGGDSLFTDLAYVPSRGTFFIHKLNNTTAAAPGGWIYEVDKTGKQIGRWTSPAAYPIGLAWMGDVDPANPYLIATDRNGNQEIYLYELSGFNPASTSAPPLANFLRKRKVELGPRGATHSPTPSRIYQVITDFTGQTLQSTMAEKLQPNDDQQQVDCSFPLTSPISAGFINARGIEIDLRDSNIWVSDYNGNIFKVVSCDGRPPTTPPIGGVDSRTGSLPQGTLLGQNHPNPVTATTSISYTLPRTMRIRMEIVAVDGTTIATLVDRTVEAGTQSVTFNASGLPSGVYRYRLVTESGGTITRTMVHVR